MLPRRDFVLATAAISAAATARQSAAQNAASNRVRVGVMGLSRGQSLAMDLAKLAGVEVSYVCEVDESRLASSIKQLEGRGSTTPKGVSDFRQILDDKNIDALVCAAPNHWHAPATIMGCKAGKHVYVEKPCSHNPLEGEWMVAAAAKYKRCVQMGSQRRSSEGMQEAMQKLHDGAIGNVRLARCYYNNLRPSIGKGAEANPPEGLDYELWQGPAPRRPYRDNVIPYNWHWFWHWGGGELANNGVHSLDVCRWGLNVDYPIRAVSSGGRYWFDDDQETPDIQAACFEFAEEKQITWDALSCNRHRGTYFCAFYGDAGALEVDANGEYRVYDTADKVVAEGKKSSGGQVEHLQNFVDAIRADDPTLLNQPILEGHKSTMLCHLGNIAYRTGRTVNCDPTNGHLLNGDDEQNALWSREYDPAWREDVSM